MTTTTDLIIFDCDGTLVDSEHLNNLAVIEILHANGLTDYTLEYSLNEFTGLRFGAILKVVSGQTGYVFPETSARDFLKAVARLSPLYMKSIESAEDVVAHAAERTKICVASNGERNNVLTSLKFANLQRFFPDNIVYTALMVENPKPAPDLFLYAAEQNQTDPARCLVIEDSVAGVTAGVEAGMQVWGFTGTHHDADAHVQTLKEAGASKVFKTMTDLKADLY